MQKVLNSFRSIVENSPIYAFPENKLSASFANAIRIMYVMLCMTNLRDVIFNIIIGPSMFYSVIYIAFL